MIYVLLTNDKKNIFQIELQEKIVSYLKFHFNETIKYRFIFCPIHIVEKNINHITNEDYILWHPFVAANNLSLVKRFLNSIVILRHKTVLIQKISRRNMINENLAINNEFKILYLEPNYDDITNDDWKLIIKPEDYLVSIQSIINKNSGLNNKI